MTTLRETFETELASMRTARDELRVQAHLFRAELKDEWALVEKRLEVIEHEFARFTRESAGPLEAVGQAAHDLLEEAKAAVARIRARSQTGSE